MNANIDGERTSYWGRLANFVSKECMFGSREKIIEWTKEWSEKELNPTYPDFEQFP